jgi:hypothetical protein
MAAEKKKPVDPVLGLVGRCFHTFDDKGVLRYQGIVRGDLGGGRYLIQYFDWIMGEPSTMAIIDIEEMMSPRAWQFYEDADHMRFWHEYRYQKPDEEA